jgi:hypothetical protein
MEEPLRHNKSAFAVWPLGNAEINRLKSLANRLNQRLVTPASDSIQRPLRLGTFF